MLPKFRNLKELMIRFSDESVCRSYLEEVRWSGKPVCPHCNGSKPYRLKDGKTFRCREKSCRKDFTVKVGLIFENSKIPLSTWFAAIYIITSHKKGISSYQLAKDLGVTQKTAWFLNHRIRETFTTGEKPEFTNIVEMDETYIGGKVRNMTKAKRAKMSEWGDQKIPVMGMVQRNGKATLKIIGKRDVFKDFASKYINREAIVITDAHIAYRGLDITHRGHVIINHANDEYVNGIYHTNTVEGFFSQLKRGIYGVYHQVSKKHLHRYCEEFSFRYSTRDLREADRFILTLQKSKCRLKYQELISKSNPDKKSVA